MLFCFDLWCNYGDDHFHFQHEVEKPKFSLLFIASNIHHFNNSQHKRNIKSNISLKVINAHLFNEQV